MTEERDYKETLSLPRTDFPMKANLPVNEPKRLERWKEMDLYAKVREARRGAEKFILHDGPPYANGHIHMGTALNKVLKDFIVRARTMEGLDAPYVPGWDCHGLPIEHQVDLELGKEKDTIPASDKRRRCRAFAERFVKIQREEFERLGAYGAWDAPYLTMNHAFEAATVRELEKFFRAGAVYRGLKPVHWCTFDLTALAEAEVEYEDHTSPAVFVEFPYLRGGEFGDAPEGTAAVIWTTTPWTLPANQAVAFHPEHDYALVEAETDGETRRWILAERLTPTLMEVFGAQGHRVLRRFPGKALEGAVFRHPFLERDSAGVLADYVTLDQGTGAVHTAPGHGREDYETGQAYGLDVISPVDDHGRFYKDLPLIGGMSVWDANPEIVRHLSETGRLVAQEKIRHQYPHCWRCRNPVLFRATPQWFISMDHNGLRTKALEAVNGVQWLPEWGRERIYGMIENRPDWCISRQRTWGVPITAFTCADCGEAVIDHRIAEKAAAWMETEGADAWFDRDAEDFTPDGLACAACGSKSFEKVTDILDVWFDSGVTHAAVLEADPELSWPADLYLEGSDQHRGWFHSSLLASVGTRGRAPYGTVLTHGYVVDADGRKMSKSLKNVIAPDKIIKQNGAEIVRLWVASENYREDMRISPEILKRSSEAYRRIRNTFRFFLGNLYDFDLSGDAVPYEKLPELDRLLLHKLAELIRRVSEAFDRYEFHTFYQTFHNFCAVDLSAFYLDVLKDRLYCEKADAHPRRSAQTVLHRLADAMVRLMAPILPFTAEEVWDRLPANPAGREPSVHLALFPAIDESERDENLAGRWGRLIELREGVLKELEEARRSRDLGSALNAKVKIAASEEFRTFLEPYLGNLPALFRGGGGGGGGGRRPAPIRTGRPPGQSRSRRPRARSASAAGWSFHPWAKTRPTRRSAADARPSWNNGRGEMNAATASRSAGKAGLALLISVAAAVVVLDQVTKIIVQRLFFLGESIPVIDGFFNLTYVRNSGAAFSFLASGDPAWVIPFFTIITLVVAVGIVYYYRKIDPAQRLHRWGFSLVLGGAVGNLIDRLLHQSVVDFLDFYAGAYHWPAFNVADSAITTGVGLILLEMLWAGKSGKVSG